MKKHLLLLSLICFCFCCKTENGIAVDYSLLPKNEEQKVVLDLSNLLTSSEIQSLSREIINYEKISSNEIAILTIDSIDPFTDIALYSSAIGNYWGVGKKNKINGLVIVIAKNERKIWLSPGDETTKILTDSICQKIIDQNIIPEFKKQNYYSGISKGLDAIIQKWD